MTGKFLEVPITPTYRLGGAPPANNVVFRGSLFIIPLIRLNPSLN